LTIKLPFPTKDGFLSFMLSVTGEMAKPICTSDCPFDWASREGAVIDNFVKPSNAITAVTAAPEIHPALNLISLLLSSLSWFFRKQKAALHFAALTAAVGNSTLTAYCNYRIASWLWS
jgi:hypothetical protein